MVRTALHIVRRRMTSQGTIRVVAHMVTRFASKVSFNAQIKGKCVVDFKLKCYDSKQQSRASNQHTDDKTKLLIYCKC